MSVIKEEKKNEVDKKLKKKNQETQSEEQVRVSMPRKSEMILMAMVDHVNDGFIGGHVSKIDLLEWMMQKFQSQMTDSLLAEIRSNFVDEVMILEHLLREAKESGSIPSDLKTMLQNHYAKTSESKKTPKKSPKVPTDLPVSTNVSDTNPSV